MCFINKFDLFFQNPNVTYVVARFDLDKTWRYLMIAVVVPTVLFVISFTTLCIITNSVKVLHIQTFFLKNTSKFSQMLFKKKYFLF